MRNYHQTSSTALGMLIRFVSAPHDDSKCSERAPSFIMHECTACNQTKLCCSLARENEIMMMFSKSGCFMGFQFGASESGQLTPMSLFSDWAVRQFYTQLTWYRWFTTGGRRETGRGNWFKDDSMLSWLLAHVPVFLPQSPQAAVSACDTLKWLLETQKTNRSLSNVISFFSLTWTASLKY